MLYFSLSLILSLMLTAALLACLIKSLRINWSRKNRRPLGYLTPVILTVLFILISLTVAIPRLMDVVNMISQSYSIETVKVNDAGLGWSKLRHEQRVYYFNHWRFQPEPGRTYRIYFTPNSRFIVYMDDVTETAEN